VLRAADGLQSKEIAVTLGVSQSTVGMWRRRFALARLDGLCDEPRPGTPRNISDDQIAQTIRLTLETTPKNVTPRTRRQERDTLVAAFDGGGRWACSFDHSPDMARLRPPATPVRELQTLH
jgi:transposase